MSKAKEDQDRTRNGYQYLVKDSYHDHQDWELGLPTGRVGQLNEFWVQAFVYLNFGKHLGIHITRMDQRNKGESALHYEIKYDRAFLKYGNLYIEQKERSSNNGGEGEWYDSWMRRGQSDMLIANIYDQIWIIPLSVLLRIEAKMSYYSAEPKKTKTSEGIALTPNTLAIVRRLHGLFYVRTEDYIHPVYPWMMNRDFLINTENPWAGNVPSDPSCPKIDLSKFDRRIVLPRLVP